MTRLQTYSGRDSWNNRVTIDHDEKKVAFTPIPYLNAKHRAKSPTYPIFIGAYTSFEIAMLLSAWVLIAHACMSVLGVDTPYTAELIGLIFGIGGGMTISLLVLWTNENLRRILFPRVTAFLVEFRNQFIFKYPKRFLLGPKQLGTTWVIPSFDNVRLEYEAEGDVSNQLSRVEITETNLSPQSWQATFYFHKRPADGFLKVVAV